ncbi:MAG: metalloregulator ArsR/SmtB family transcription factor [Acidobacteriia bacterium]|jgi:ArsR family transcriptional regulator|nr:metalloregulator ArsR/SmtB family transcription factor [Terriglobia bacterium]
MESGPLQGRSGEVEAIFKLQAQICRVLGHPRRLQILDLLAQGERSNAELLQILGTSKVNLSQHLALLRRVGLVESRQQGRQIFHRLAIEEVEHACRVIREVVAQQLSQNSRLARALRHDPGNRGKTRVDQP